MRNSNVRSRLLAATTLIAVVVAAIFGFSAYRIVVDMNDKRTSTEFEKSTQSLAATINFELNQQNDEVLTSDTRNQFLLNYSGSIFLLDLTGKVLQKVNSSNEYGTVLPSVLKNMTNLPESQQGYVTVDDIKYTWSRRALADHPVQVLRVGVPLSFDEVLPESLAIRLTIAGLIAVWISAWGGLIMTSAIAQRLEKQSAELVHMAHHDELTGLPNRTSLSLDLENGLKEAEANGSSLALIIIDLNRFKDINDTMGHHYGDNLLKQIGQRMSDNIGSYSAIARLGGDEFAVLLTNVDAETANKQAKNLVSALDSIYTVFDIDIEVEISLGISMYPTDGADASTLAQHADTAMYYAKKNNLGYAHYNEKNDQNSVEKLMLGKELKEAVQQSQFVLYYQPKLDLKLRRYTSVEALIRWNHPQRGLVFPDEFIDALDKFNLMQLVTDWALTEAINQCKVWADSGIECSIAVNLSPTSLLDSELHTRIADQLEQCEVPPSMLQLELTESALMSDINRAAKALEKMERMGIRIAIDDFGTGMSSLAYLKRLPVHDIKIDKSFVLDICSDPDNEVIVRSIVDLSHNMGRSVIAEGVEDSESLKLLSDMGCDCAQGYFLSRPLPEADIRHLLYRPSEIIRDRPRLVNI